MKKLVITLLCFSTFQLATAQTEVALIKETLMNYVEGSTNGKPALLKKAFHPELNLYYVKKDQVATWAGTSVLSSKI